MKKIILILILVAVYSICQAKTWQAYTLYTTPDDADHLMLNDTDDPTDNAAGTLKRLAWLYVQQRDADLTAVAALTTTAYGRALLEVANLAALRIILSVGIANGNLVEVNGTPVDEEVAIWTATGLDSNSEAEFKTAFNMEAGTDFQAYDADLLAIAALATTAYGRGLLELADAAALLALTQDQSLNTDDDAEFNTVTITAGDSASGGFEIDNMPDTDLTCQGILTTGTAGAENMAFGEIVTVANATGKWILANANSTGVLEARGINCQPGIDTDTDDPILVMLTGYIRDDTWDFTDDINKDMLLDETAGDMVLADGAIPADTGDIIQIIGYVTMTSTIEAFYFNPQPVFSVLE